jgi:hypothetical protein
MVGTGTREREYHPEQKTEAALDTLFDEIEDAERKSVRPAVINSGSAR